MGLVGVYTSQREIASVGWEAIDAMKEQVGLNLIILGAGSVNIGGHISLIGGGIPSQETVAKAPFKVFADKENRLKDVLDQAHRRDMDVWLCAATFAEMDNALNFPELAFRDIAGDVLPPEHKHGFHWAWSWCPSNLGLREYYRTLYGETSKRYEVDGFTLTHLRYSPLGHNFWNFFGCGCPSCVQAAGKMGYGFGDMKAALEKLLERLKSIDAKKVTALAEQDLSFTDLLYYLGPSPALVDWVNFRSELITTALEEFYASAKGGNEEIVFGSDNFPPSFALLSGQKYGEFERTADFLSPLLSHPLIFTVLGFVEVADRLVGWNKDLLEADILRLLYKVFGYSGLNLPNTVDKLIEKTVPADDYSHPHVDIDGIYRLEASKVRMFTSGRKPVYGVVSAHGNVTPRGATERVKAILDAQMDGVILQVWGIPGPKENLAAIGETLRNYRLIG